MKATNVGMFLIFCTILCFIWAFNVHEASSKSAEYTAAEQRSFYLTQDTYLPTETESACAEGYHFANIFELDSFSTLTYNTNLGLGLGDSGLGPPSLEWGWIRNETQNSTDDNCSNWTESSPESTGSIAFMEGPQEWGEVAGFCDLRVRVWCVSNYDKNLLKTNDWGQNRSPAAQVDKGRI